MKKKTTTQAPYHSPALDAILRTKLKTIPSIRYTQEDCALQSVALVGFLLPDTDSVRDGHVTAADINSDDLSMITDGFTAMAHAGAKFHPQTRFHVYSLLPPVRSDFLEKASKRYDTDHYPQSDASMVLYIPIVGFNPLRKGYDISNGIDEHDILNPYDKRWSQMVSVSALHKCPGIWPKASLAHGNALSILFGDIDCEVTTDEFSCSSDYKIARTNRNNAQNANKRQGMGIAYHPQRCEAKGMRFSPE